MTIYERHDKSAETSMTCQASDSLRSASEALTTSTSRLAYTCIDSICHLFFVLNYLRKRLSAEEMHELHTQVVDGMVIASMERMASSGASFEDTGSTAKPFEGEEIDWYW